MPKKKIDTILVIILLLSALLRFVYLGRFPQSFNMDEASKGYTAYSLLTTGKNFRGQKWPLYITDFSDKLPRTMVLYLYSTIPFVRVFGLNEASTRMPAALYGTLTIAVVYFLAYELFKKREIALYASFFLAISPWHILMSRMAVEPATFPPLFLFGWYCLQKGLKNKRVFLYTGVCLLGLSFYAQQIAQLLTPLFLFFFVIINRKFFIKHRYLFINLMLFLFIIIFPLLYLYLTRTHDMMAHYQGLSILNFGFINALKLFTSYYMANLLFPFLLFHYHTPIVLLATVGFIKLLKEIRKNRIYMLFIIVFLLALIPSSLTYNFNSGLPHIRRSIGKTGFVEMFAAFYLYQYISKHKIREKAIYIILLGIIVINSYAFYLIKYPLYLENDRYTEYGWKEVVNYISEVEDNYDKVVITDKSNQPFIYLLFYKQYPPEKFQHIKVVRSYDDSPYPWETVHSFDKYEFCNINECYDPDKNYLYVARESEIPNVKEDFTIKPAYGNQVYRIITNE